MKQFMICPGAARFGCCVEECAHATVHEKAKSCDINCYKSGDVLNCVPSTYGPKPDLNMPSVRGVRAEHLRRLNKGFCGTLSRHGKTLVIVLEFSSEALSESAENYICGKR